MKQDSQIQLNVMEELRHSPLLNVAQIGVSVTNGIVTLSGIVDSYPKKIAAERAVWHVAHVKGIAQEMEVRLDNSNKVSDTEIAQTVMKTLEWQSGLDTEKIKILVDDGEVTIEGFVDWDYQRKLVISTLANIKGVNVIINNLKISEKPVASDLKNKIVEAFKRSADVNAYTIQTSVAGNTVTLTGTVRSWHEKQQAEHIVWSMTGVCGVKNDLLIESDKN